jgi:hypothetical protein
MDFFARRSKTMVRFLCHLDNELRRRGYWAVANLVSNPGQPRGQHTSLLGRALDDLLGKQGYTA